MNEQKSRRRSERRPLAEWVTLALSLAVVLGIVGALFAFELGRDGQVVIEVTPRTDEAREAGGLYYVPLEVTNRGGPAALDVVVRAISGEETLELRLDIVPGGGSDEVTAVFASRPERIDARVLSFRVP